MAEAATKLPIKTEAPPVTRASKVADWIYAESILSSAAGHRGILAPRPWLRFTPAIDIVEKDKALEVTAELPGLDAKNIDLQLSDGVLTIKGEKQEEKEEKTKDRYVSERRYGSFRRSLQIPSGVDAEEIEASFKSGVLMVSLPKSPEAQKKQKTIPVSVK
jgi:HSP20 family protein